MWIVREKTPWRPGFFNRADATLPRGIPFLPARRKLHTIGWARPMFSLRFSSRQGILPPPFPLLPVSTSLRTGGLDVRDWRVSGTGR